MESEDAFLISLATSGKVAGILVFRPFSTKVEARDRELQSHPPPAADFGLDMSSDSRHRCCLPRVR